jgi:dipeptidyl aminopeptidase/acylaminoacyl peptidase
LVPIESPQAMCEELKGAGVTAELYVVPNADHIFAMMDHTALKKCADFLVEQLQASEEKP